MYLKSIRLDNLKGFKNLNFDFERPNESFEGWTVFVGGNSSGKSALLKSMALALMGPDESRQLLNGMQGWIHAGEKRASVVAQLTWDRNHDRFRKGGANPGASFEAGVRWVAEKAEDVPTYRTMEKRNAAGTRIQTAERGPWDPNADGWYSSGYGPMRRLSGSSTESVRYTVGGNAVSRFVTLFREDAALSESEEWLRKTHSRYIESKEKETKALLDGVRQLLNEDLLPHGMQIARITVDKVYLRDKRGIELPMRDISDGCRSVYATVLDLVHGMAEVYGVDGLFDRRNGSTVVTTPGVVLIDEIEAHLHPAWQREIPLWLKKHFPRIQFLVTTHSPLVAQAADENGVFILPSQDDLDREPRGLNADEYQKLKWGRAEKTLLGVAFGLQSTRSRWANQQIDRWRLLDAKKRSATGLTANEKREYGSLHKQLTLALDPVTELDA